MFKQIPAEYVAGLFDGEGSISAPKTGGSRNRRSRLPTLTVRLVNNHYGILKRLQTQFGGKIHKHCFKRAYEFAQYGENALAFLKAIYPHLVIKANIVWLAICFQNQVQLIKSKHPKGFTLDDEEVLVRLAFRDIVLKINGW